MSAPEAFTIETGIPLPKSRRAGGALTSALRSLAAASVGDSILLAGIAQRKLGPYLQSAAGNGWYATRVVEGGIRVWKIAEPKQMSRLRKASSQ